MHYGLKVSNGPVLFNNDRKILCLFEYLAKIQIRACLLVLAKSLILAGSDSE